MYSIWHTLTLHYFLEKPIATDVCATLNPVSSCMWCSMRWKNWRRRRWCHTETFITFGRLVVTDCCCHGSWPLAGLLGRDTKNLLAVVCSWIGSPQLVNGCICTVYSITPLVLYTLWPILIFYAPCILHILESLLSHKYLAHFPVNSATKHCTSHLGMLYPICPGVIASRMCTVIRLFFP